MGGALLELGDQLFRDGFVKRFFLAFHGGNFLHCVVIDFAGSRPLAPCGNQAWRYAVDKTTRYFFNRVGAIRPASVPVRGCEQTNESCALANASASLNASSSEAPAR